ncbi:oligosaccharide flippase family protein [Pleomorphovibrio marinus]|uniref:oligosaccharide flippase family protein n=1 Tax=Pleomorphovibrio marinus TaxID=2164132 RepID=UPI000E0C6203|nr:oligosaccharide flippase family protein [Pleomorphovibrio marinus]
MWAKINQFPLFHLIRHKSIQNFIFLIIIQASNVLISLISMPLLVTSLGVDQFGLVNLALSIIILANILVGFGYNLSAPREVALLHRDKKALSFVFSRVISGKFSMALLAAILIIIGVFGFGLFQEYQLILVYSLLLLFSEATLPLWFFQGMEKMKLVSISNVFSKLLYLLGLVLFIHRPDQAKWVNFLLGSTGLAINILLLVYIHISLKIFFQYPKIGQIWKSLLDNFQFFLSNLASHISTNGGLIILSFFAAAETLGMFSLAERISMVLRLIPSLIIQAIFPNTSRLFQSDKPRFYRFLRRVYRWTLVLGIIGSMTVFALAPYIIHLLARSTFEESVQYMRILAFIPFFACLNIPNVMIILVKGQKNLMFRSSWLMALYMVPACWVLTHIYGGMGLCFGLLSTEIAVLLICTFINFMKNKLEISTFWKLKGNLIESEA